MSLITFAAPVTACFHGGEWDTLEVEILRAYDRVRPEITAAGVQLCPILAPVEWDGTGYYLRIRHSPPIAYIAVR